MNFTGASIMWYAIWDFTYKTEHVDANKGANDKKENEKLTPDDLTKSNDLLKFPKLYELSKNNTHFNVTVFWGWIAYGFV